MSDNAISLPVREAYQELASVLNSRSDPNLTNQLSQAWARIEKDSTDVGAVNLLGMLAENIRQYSLAETFFRLALKLAPQTAILHGNLANVLRVQGKIDAALLAYKEALKFNPDFELYYLAVATIFISQGENKQLREWLGKALAQCPDSVGLLVNMGEAIKRSGDSETAITYFRKALALPPSHTALTPSRSYIYQTLAHTKKFVHHDDDVDDMEALLEDDGLPDEARSRLNFALGKVYEDMSDYSRSFEYYEQGNQIVRGGYDYSHDENAMLFSSIEDVFDQRLFQGYEGAGCDSDMPIFILSMPRSGSTLLEQMLAAHQKIYGAGELLLLPDIIHSLWTKYVTPKGAVFPLGAATLSSKVLRGAGEHYVNVISSLIDKKDIIRVTDKLPLNFLNVGVIKLILPNARIIHCYRDPVDTCLSCFKQLFSVGHRYAYNLEELGGYYKLYQELMDHWHKVLPGHILDVEYESLVDDQAGQLKRILEFCGLPWDDACLKFHESDRAAMTASSTQVKKPLYRSGIGYWRHYEDHLKPLLDVLGRNRGGG